MLYVHFYDSTRFTTDQFYHIFYFVPFDIYRSGLSLYFFDNITAFQLALLPARTTGNDHLYFNLSVILRL
ncbi:hypothetical protein D3C80_1651750 [compost metagenome]